MYVDRFDQTEVQQNHSPRFGQEHVRRFDIAVNQLRVVQRDNARAELEKICAQAPILKLARVSGDPGHVANAVAEWPSFEHLHRKERRIAAREQLVDANEIRMADVSERAEFAF